MSEVAPMVTVLLRIRFLILGRESKAPIIASTTSTGMRTNGLGLYGR